MQGQYHETTVRSTISLDGDTVWTIFSDAEDYRRLHFDSRMLCLVSASAPSASIAGSLTPPPPLPPPVEAPPPGPPPPSVMDQSPPPRMMLPRVAFGSSAAMPELDTPSGRPSTFVAVSSAASCGNERPVEDGQPSVPLSPVEAPPPGFGIDRLEAADANLQAAAAKKERVEATFGAVRYAAAEACCMAEEVAVLHSSMLFRNRRS